MKENRQILAKVKDLENKDIRENVYASDRYLAWKITNADMMVKFSKEQVKCKENKNE